MVKYYPNNEYFDKDAILARTDPKSFAESDYQARQRLKKGLIKIIDLNLPPSELERAIADEIKTFLPGTIGYLKKVNTSQEIHAKLRSGKEECLGKIIA